MVEERNMRGWYKRRGFTGTKNRGNSRGERKGSGKGWAVYIPMMWVKRE